MERLFDDRFVRMVESLLHVPGMTLEQAWASTAADTSTSLPPVAAAPPAPPRIAVTLPYGRECRASAGS
jgi:hypothetical protein